MIRSPEELYERFYATALQTIADARDLDKFDFEGQRELARRTAEMCVIVVKELRKTAEMCVSVVKELRKS